TAAADRRDRGGERGDHGDERRNGKQREERVVEADRPAEEVLHVDAHPEPAQQDASGEAAERSEQAYHDAFEDDEAEHVGPAETDRAKHADLADAAEDAHQQGVAEAQENDKEDHRLERLGEAEALIDHRADVLQKRATGDDAQAEGAVEPLENPPFDRIDAGPGSDENVHPVDEPVVPPPHIGAAVEKHGPHVVEVVDHDGRDGEIDGPAWRVERDRVARPHAEVHGEVVRDEDSAFSDQRLPRVRGPRDDFLPAEAAVGEVRLVDRSERHAGAAEVDVETALARDAGHVGKRAERGGDAVVDRGRERATAEKRRGDDQVGGDLAAELVDEALPEALVNDSDEDIEERSQGEHGGGDAGPVGMARERRGGEPSLDAEDETERPLTPRREDRRARRRDQEETAHENRSADPDEDRRVPERPYGDQRAGRREQREADGRGAPVDGHDPP